MVKNLIYQFSDKDNTTKLIDLNNFNPNLFDYTKINSITTESAFGNVTITNNNNGSFTCSGSNNTDAHIVSNYFTTILPAGVYYISQISGSKFFIAIYDSISPNYHLIAASNQSFTLNETKQVWIYIAIRTTTNITETISPMLVKGSTPLPFQSYTGEIQYAINQSYSYNEIDTGATWVDGKKIYKRTFETEVISIGANSWISICSNTNIDYSKIIKYEGIIRGNAYSATYSLTGFHNSEITGIKFTNENTGTIYFGSNAAWAYPIKFYITIYYYK